MIRTTRVSFVKEDRELIVTKKSGGKLRSVSNEIATNVENIKRAGLGVTAQKINHSTVSQAIVIHGENLQRLVVL